LIYNVTALPNTHQVAVGAEVGHGVVPQWCSDTHIHVAMIKNDTDEEIDPTGYLRKREMKLPEWKQNCDHYLLVWKVGVLFDIYLLENHFVFC